jgi:hypothetical protein
MADTQQHSENSEKFGLTTRALARVCHGCSVCAFADQRPNSTFGRIMRWHRGWCPAWAAHTKVHGEKQPTAPKVSQ